MCFTFGPVEEFADVDIQLLARERKSHSQWVLFITPMGRVTAIRGQELPDPVGDPCKQLRTRTLLEGIGDGPLFVDDFKVAAARERRPADAKVRSTWKKNLFYVLVGDNVHLNGKGYDRRR